LLVFAVFLTDFFEAFARSPGHFFDQRFTAVSKQDAPSPHNETLSVAAMRVCNPNCAPVAIRS
jgi:hypothetical protein